MKKWITAAVVVVSIVCFTGIAFAGVTMIVQPSIYQTFPVKITQPGSYQLQSNLVVPTANTTAIWVRADNVTIDLNGFAILGPTVCSGTPVTSCTPIGTGRGIDADGSKNIKVYNGTVSGMGSFGIVTGDGAIIESMRVASNGLMGIAVTFGAVSGSTAIGNGHNGISLNSSGTVSGSTAIGNAHHGIEVGYGTVSGNTANDNGNNGIEVNRGTVSGNTANDNAGDGIHVFYSGTVNGNTTLQNTGHGLNLDASVGYLNSVSHGNTGTNCNGGVNLGMNYCL